MINITPSALAFRSGETTSLPSAGGCIILGGDVPCPSQTGGATVATLDPTGASATRMALGAATGQIHRQVSQRLAFAPAPAPQVTQGATASDTPRGWATVFGSRSRRGEEGLALAFKHSFYGVVGGYDAQTESGQRVGLFLGFGRGKVRTSDISSITDTATRGFVGVYGQHVIGDLTLNGSLVGSSWVGSGIVR